MHVKQFSGRLSGLVALVLGIVILTGPAAQAAYYNDYTTVAETPNTQDTTSAQGFATGPNFSYVVKVRSPENDKGVIYRVDNRSGALKLMTNGGTSTSTSDDKLFTTALGHANDMTIVDINGEHFFFIVTMSDSGAQLVKLRYDGSVYYKVGSYQVRFKGNVETPSGIELASVSSTHVSFLFKSGAYVRNGSIPLTANSGTIDLASAFNLDTANAKIDGAAVNLDGYSNQGFYWNAAKDILYYPLTKDNRSVVLIYRRVNPATTGTVLSDENVSFRITSSAYDKFEIESLGLRNGQLYFNTNRSGDSDGVHVFKDYNAG